MARPEDYPHSSYRSFISRGPEGLVYRDLVFGMISKHPKDAPKRYMALTNRQIGQMVGDLSYSAVSKAYQRFSAKLRDDRRLQRKVKEVISLVKT